MRTLLPPTFEDLERPLAVGVYNERHSPMLLTEGDLPSTVAASCAVPKLFARVRIGTDSDKHADAVELWTAQACKRGAVGVLASWPSST